MAGLFLAINPLLAFAVYFGVWHSLHSIVDEISFFKSDIRLDVWIPLAMEEDPGVGGGHMDEDEVRAREGTHGHSHDEEVKLLDVVRFLVLASPYTLMAVLSM
ncbi:hypothetical protein HDU67_007463, partial [Dinochytrium kinnereticum]